MPIEQPILSKRLEGKRICICAGAGGVGKTTISAALALGLASEGKRVAVLTEAFPLYVWKMAAAATR